MTRTSDKCSLTESWQKYFSTIGQITIDYSIADMISSFYSIIDDTGIHEDVHFNIWSKINWNESVFCELPEMIDSIILWPDYISIFCDYLIKAKYDLNISPAVYCIQLIMQMEIPRKNHELDVHLKSSERIGPLNKKKSPYLVYPKTNHNLIDPLVKKIKYRYSNRHTEQNINYHTKYIIVVKREHLNIVGYADPEIHRIIDNDLVKLQISMGEPMRLALVPFCSKQYFNVRKDCDLFYIDNPEGKEGVEIIDRYIKCIQKCFEVGANIVVFPEMVLIPEAYAKIKMYLKESKLDHQMVLLVCGSTWHNNSNTLFAVSGQGDEIFKYNKISPYTLIEKDKDGQEKSYHEALDSRIEYHEYIDIEGIGRLRFMICLDYLNDRMSAMECYFDSTVNIISAYTPSLGPFYTHSKSIAEEYLSASIVCNACSSKLSNSKNTQVQESPTKIEVGYVAIPGKHDSENHNDVVCEYYFEEGCKNNCHDGQHGCIKLFSINPNVMMLDGNGKKSISISCEHILVPIM